MDISTIDKTIEAINFFNSRGPCAVCQKFGPVRARLINDHSLALCEEHGPFNKDGEDIGTVPFCKKHNLHYAKYYYAKRRKNVSIDPDTFAKILKHHRDSRIFFVIS